MSNYAATVVTIKEIRNHPNADRLALTTIFGNNVIIGKDVKVGDRGLFFPLESQLGEEFCQANDLIRRKDENGKPAGGMFDANRRVRAQTLRGEKSMGFFIELDSLEKFQKFTGTSAVGLLKFVDGFEIEKVDGLTISQKYIPKTNQTQGLGKRHKEGKRARESKIIPGQFHFHFDTAQLGRNIHRINPTDIVVLTWKFHGTSAIVSNCLVKRELGLFDKILSKMPKLITIDKHRHEYIYASRRVVKNEFAESKNHFYNEDLWTTVGKEHFEGKLHTGETIYYEIVGFTKAGSAIQGGYDYKCDPSGQLGPQHKIFVYRITQTAADGTVVELQWNQVKERCKELGVETVVEIFYGVADISYFPEIALIDIALLPESTTLEDAMDQYKKTGVVLMKSEEDGEKLIEVKPKKMGENLEEWQKKYLAYLQQKYVYDQDCQFCKNKVPAEGICLRKEGLSIEVFKLKSFRFLEHETKSLDKGEVDTETQESYERQDDMIGAP